jgi:hypothetical protein
MPSPSCAARHQHDTTHLTKSNRYLPTNNQPNNTIHTSRQQETPPQTNPIIHAMCNFTPHRFTNWVRTLSSSPATHHQSKPLTILPVCSQINITNQFTTNPNSKCPSPTTGALVLCIPATRTGEICAPSARELEPEQKRPGTCGACELVRVAGEEKLAKARVLGTEVGMEGEKKQVERSLPLRGKGKGPVKRQSTRLRDRGGEDPMRLTRR